MSLEGGPSEPCQQLHEWAQKHPPELSFEMTATPAAALLVACETLRHNCTAKLLQIMTL